MIPDGEGALESCAGMARNPDAAIRVAVRRLWVDGELERVDTGVYRIKNPDETSSEAAFFPLLIALPELLGLGACPACTRPRLVLLAQTNGSKRIL